MNLFFYYVSCMRTNTNTNNPNFGRNTSYRQHQQNHSNKTIQQVFIRENKQEVESDDFIMFDWC